MSLRSTAPARAVSCGRRRVDHLGAPEVRRSGSDGVCVRVVDVRSLLSHRLSNEGGDTAFFSAADISRRFLAGLASDLLSAAAAAFVGGGEEERRDAERAFGADAPRICSTSVKALISAWRRSISLWRSAIACAISLMPVESSGPAMGMSNTNAGFLSPGRGHVGGSSRERARTGRAA